MCKHSERRSLFESLRSNIPTKKDYQVFMTAGWQTVSSGPKPVIAFQSPLLLPKGIENPPHPSPPDCQVATWPPVDALSTAGLCTTFGASETAALILLCACACPVSRTHLIIRSRCGDAIGMEIIRRRTLRGEKSWGGGGNAD